MAYKPKHPYLGGRWDYLKLAYLSYAGGWKYIDEQLVQHSRERDAHFEKRKTYAFYINIIGKVVDILSGFLIRNSNRTIGIADDTLRGEYLSEIDLYRPVNEFLRDKICDYLLTGNAIALADSTGEGTEARAYLHDIDYRNLSNFQVENGRLLSVEIYYPGEVDGEEAFVSYTDTNIEVSKGKVKKTATNTAGKIPFVAVSKNLRPKRAYLEDAIYTNRALFNLYNTVNKELFDTGFMILAIPTMEDTVDVETLKFWRTIPGHESEKPTFIEPPTGHLDFTMRFIDSIIEKLLNTLNIYRSEEKDTSGISKSYDYSMMTSLLTQMADVFERFERKMWEALALYDQRIKVDDIKIEYKRDFDIRSLGEELDNAIKLMAVDVSDTFGKEIRKKLASKMIEDDTTRKKIFDEIDADPVETVEHPERIPTNEAEDNTGGNEDE